jgi:hypothetical protein
MQRDERAVIRRALRRVGQATGQRRVRGTAARGFAEVALLDVCKEGGVACSSRVKRSPLVALDGIWRTRSPLRFAGNRRHRSFGCLLYGRRAPHAGWVTMRRARDKQGQGGMWYLGSKRPLAAGKAAAE